MNKDLIVANLNLHAVLPRLGELVRLDDEAKALAKNMSLSVKFTVSCGPCVILHFKNGVVTSETDPNGEFDLGLYFSSCAKLNAMFAGEKVTPLPYKKIWKLGAMGAFTKLTELLPKYLKPSEQDLKNADFRAKHVEMALMTGLSGANAIAQYDTRLKKITGKLTDGTIVYDINNGGPKATVFIKDKQITVKSGAIEDPTTTLEIKDVDFATEMFAGKVDTFAALGAGDIKASGALLLGDHFNTLVDRASYFLA